METNLDDEFFVILPSDSNLDTHSDNKNNKYKVEFDTPIEFSEDYECALWDINIPGLIPKLRSFNVKVSYIKYNISNSETSWNFNDHILMELTFRPIENANFLDFLREFAEFVNKNMKFLTKKRVMEEIHNKKYIKTLKEKNFGYSPPSIRNNPKSPYELTISSGNFHVELTPWRLFRIVFIFEEKLYEILQVPKQYRYPSIVYGNKPEIFEGESILKTSAYTCSFPPDYITDFKGEVAVSILVLSDIVGESHINENKKPILKMLLSNKNGQLQNFSQNVQYFPVIKKEIKMIEIKIVNLAWELIQFRNGSVNVVLNFRRK